MNKIIEQYLIDSTNRRCRIENDISALYKEHEEVREAEVKLAKALGQDPPETSFSITWNREVEPKTASQPPITATQERVDQESDSDIAERVIRHLRKSGRTLDEVDVLILKMIVRLGESSGRKKIVDALKEDGVEIHTSKANHRIRKFVRYGVVERVEKPDFRNNYYRLKEPDKLAVESPDMFSNGAQHEAASQP